MNHEQLFRDMAEERASKVIKELKLSLTIEAKIWLELEFELAMMAASNLALRQEVESLQEINKLLGMAILGSPDES